jgi:probable F420-dependent oxidoreductase
MKIGAFASFFAPSTAPDVLSSLARNLDSAGMDSLWFGEHVMLFDEMEFPYPGSADGRLPVPEGDGAPDQATIISYLASQTERLRFGTGITLVPQRNPIYTAKEFATLDWLTNGRIDLGIGVGWCKEEVESCGYSWFDRGERCDEALDLMRKLWSEPVTTHTGKHFTVRGARMDPKPVQTPHIPLIIGGFSPAAMRRTAQYGSGWLGFGLDPKSTRHMLGQIDAALEAAGRARSDVEIIMMPGAEGMQAAEQFAELGVDRLLPMVALGDAKQVEQRLVYLAELKSRFDS